MPLHQEAGRAVRTLQCDVRSVQCPSSRRHFVLHGNDGCVSRSMGPRSSPYTWGLEPWVAQARCISVDPASLLASPTLSLQVSEFPRRILHPQICTKDPGATIALFTHGHQLLPGQKTPRPLQPFEYKKAAVPNVWNGDRAASMPCMPEAA